MKLSLYEQETIILYNQAEATAEVYTHDMTLLKKLRRLAEKYPEQIKKRISRPLSSRNGAYLSGSRIALNAARPPVNVPKLPGISRPPEKRVQSKWLGMCLRWSNILSVPEKQRRCMALRSGGMAWLAVPSTMIKTQV